MYYYIGQGALQAGSAAAAEALEHRFGFDLPLSQQYWHCLSGILFGQTITDGGQHADPAAPPPASATRSGRTTAGRHDLILQALAGQPQPRIGAAILWLIGGVTVGTISALQAPAPSSTASA